MLQQLRTLEFSRPLRLRLALRAALLRDGDVRE